MDFVGKKSHWPNTGRECRIGPLAEKPTPLFCSFVFAGEVVLKKLFFFSKKKEFSHKVIIFYKINLT